MERSWSSDAAALGVTYKAIDTHLRCLVALKIIRAQFIGNESARSRFLREARAAASVCHSNVATVHHLGESGGNYFYAMEFVDGETLESLLHRRGRLEIELALENRDAGRCRLNCDPQTASRASRHQAQQYHGHLG